MSGNTQSGGGEDDVTVNAGSETDQHVTGSPETGTFITDEAPTADTPAHGSSNAVFNAARGNRVDPDDPDSGGEVSQV